MKKGLMDVMQNDSLAAELAKGHGYKRSLAGDKLKDGDFFDSVDHAVSDAEHGFKDGLRDFIEMVPLEVWFIVFLAFLAFIFYRLYYRGMLGKGFSSTKVELGEDDNIYEIDFDKDIQEAMLRSDYAALVRLVYLRTLRSLDQAQRIVWRIYKTPSQYDVEVGVPAFHQMTREFIKVRYGKYPAGKALYEQMVSWHRQVMEGGVS